MLAQDTIVAIATGTGAGGVGIVRLSGPAAFTVADGVLRRAAPRATGDYKGHTLHRAVVREPESGDEIDDALVAVFHAPRSYTGEDVVEIQAHGGPVTLKRILAACLGSGARAARPGEFTERAFLHGKMDLAQAEAVADLVAARTVEAQRVARRQVAGDLSAAVNEAIGAITEALARIEASIDFPEEVGDIDPEAVDAPLRAALQRIRTLLATAGWGRRLAEGVTVVIAGRPNVGKSSLLNALAGSERAIVTDVPGTTRDIVSETLNLGGLPVLALDTAGIRETSDPVERIGVTRAREAVVDADVVVAVIDATAGVTPEDEHLLESLENRSRVIAINKSDRATPADLASLSAALQSEPAAVIETSAVTGQGIAALGNEIAAAAAGGAATESAVMVTSARHEAALRAAVASLDAARDTLHKGLPAELIAVDAHGALRHLGEITGETAREEIIAGIFSRFCIGK